MAQRVARVAGVVLCGGHSSRMGTPKALVPFGPETMLERVVRVVGQAVEPVLVVAAIGQELPALPADVRVVHDRTAGRGPLEGIAVGLQAVFEIADGAGRSACDAAFVASCDVPLLTADFVRFVASALGDQDAATPVLDGFPQPLASVYRLSLLARIEALLAAGRLGPIALLNEVRTRRLAEDELRTVDPQQTALRNVNQPEDVQAALRIAGLD